MVGRFIKGYGARRWCRRNRVDAAAESVFLSLSLEEQDMIREQGSVWNARNPSQVVMARIRALLGGGYVQKTVNRMRVRPPCPRGPRIAVCLRGEAFRTG